MIFVSVWRYKAVKKKDEKIGPIRGRHFVKIRLMREDEIYSIV